MTGDFEELLEARRLSSLAPPVPGPFPYPRQRPTLVSSNVGLLQRWPACLRSLRFDRLAARSHPARGRQPMEQFRITPPPRSPGRQGRRSSPGSH